MRLCLQLHLKFNGVRTSIIANAGPAVAAQPEPVLASARGNYSCEVCTCLHLHSLLCWGLTMLRHSACRLPSSSRVFYVIYVLCLLYSPQCKAKPSSFDVNFHRRHRAASGVHVKRTPGVAIFYDESIYGVPHAMVELVRFISDNWISPCFVLRSQTQSHNGRAGKISQIWAPQPGSASAPIPWPHAQVPCSAYFIHAAGSASCLSMFVHSCIHLLSSSSAARLLPVALSQLTRLPVLSELCKSSCENRLICDCTHQTNSTANIVLSICR